MQADQVLVGGHKRELEDFGGRGKKLIGRIAMRESDGWNSERYLDCEWRFHQT